MDQDFFMIKHQILEHTARTLDTAFSQYKEKSPKWSMYEEIEKKGLQLLKELQEYIQTEEHFVKKVSRKGQDNDELKENYREVSNRTVHYAYMSE